MNHLRVWLAAAAWVGALVANAQALQLQSVQTIFATSGLTETSAVVASPDGRQVYAAGRADDAIVAFQRDGDTGHLSVAQVLRDGVGRVDGIRSIVGLAISADGEFVYAAASGDDDIAVFEREPATGRLSPVQVFRDEPGPADAFTGAVTVSADGRNVYATGFDSVSAFARDPVSGIIELIGRHRISTTTFQLEGTNALVVSPDDRFVYVDSFDDDIVVFRRDTPRGDLVRVGATAGAPALVQITGLAISPDGRSLFATGYDTDSLTVFDRDLQTGLLTVGQMIRDEGDAELGLDGAFSVTASADGRRVLVTGLESSSLAAFDRDPATTRLTFSGRLVDGEGGVAGMAGSFALAITPDGRNAYVAALFGNAVVGVAIGTGITFLEAQTNQGDIVPEIADVSVVALAPDGRHVYTVGARDGAIAAFARDAASGRLLPITVVPRSGRRGLTAPSLAFDAAGSRLLITSPDSGLDVFERDVRSGVPTLLNHIDATFGSPAATALSFTRAIAISPDGSRLFAVSDFNDAVGAFAFDAATGHVGLRALLGAPETALDHPTALVMSSDGQYVYVVGSEQGSLFVLARDPSSDALSISQTLRDGVGGVTGLVGGGAIALSPDERSLIVASGDPRRQGNGADSLVIFDRDDGTGRLNYRTTLSDQLAGVEGLAGVSSIAVSADGRFLVTAAADANALATFRRDLATGSVTFDRAIFDGASGVDTLRGVTSAVISRDSRFAYAAAPGNGALSVLQLIADGISRCPADCDGDGEVVVGEITKCIAATLGSGAATCAACDADGSGIVDVTDLLRGVDAALTGCDH